VTGYAVGLQYAVKKYWSKAKRIVRPIVGWQLSCLRIAFPLP